MEGYGRGSEALYMRRTYCLLCRVAGSDGSWTRWMGVSSPLEPAAAREQGSRTMTFLQDAYRFSLLRHGFAPNDSRCTLCVAPTAPENVPNSKGEYPHRPHTMRTPCQGFEQLLQEMVYRERSCRWYLVGSEALPFPLIGSG